MVIHDVGLVTEWVASDCVGEVVTVTEPKGSFAMPDTASWLILVGDLTAMPAMARIADHCPGAGARVGRGSRRTCPTTSRPARRCTGSTNHATATATCSAVVESLAWPEGDGYFWMAGESAQMRAIRKHLMRERRMPSAAYDVMGYWRATQSAGARQPRAVDPEPIWRAGKRAGKSDEEIWADYDEARTP